MIGVKTGTIRISMQWVIAIAEFGTSPSVDISLAVIFVLRGATTLKRPVGSS